MPVLAVALSVIVGLSAQPAPAQAVPAVTVSGRILDWTGTPEAGIAVSPGFQSSTVLAVTAVDGTFSYQQAPNDSQRLNVSMTAGRANDRSISYADLGLFQVSTSDLDIGAIRIGRLDQPRRLVVTDTQGDPIPNASWSATSECSATETRDDLPRSPGEGPAEVHACAMLSYDGYNPTLPPLRSDTLGQLFFTLPTGYADKLIEQASLVVADGGGATYSPKLRDATYDAATATYTLRVANIDASPLKPPTAPQTVSLSGKRNGALTLRWQTPPSVGSLPLVGYTATVSAPGVPPQTRELAATTNSTTFTVPRGNTYSASIIARSDAGQGSPATATFRAVFVPTRPTRIVIKKMGRRTRHMSWLPVRDDGGAKRVIYRVHIDGKRVASTPGTEIAIRNLKPGRHVAYVVAVNEAGSSPSGPRTHFRVRRR